MKARVLASGGIDSTTCLAMAVDRYGAQNVTALSVSYGQKHSRELMSAKAVAKHYGVELLTIDLAQMFAYSDCSLLMSSDKDIPEESYAKQQEAAPGPVSTYVPFRNGLFLSAAASIALSLGCETVWYGAHADDAAGNAYPDCSESFVDAMGRAINEGTGGALSLVVPFVTSNKAEVVRTGLKLSAPYHLTWSCYNGGDRPCGKCATCIDRAKAFAQNGVSDPAMTY